MNTQEKCQQCGAPLTRSEIPFGNGAVCPRCLLGLGLSDPQATEASPSFHSPPQQRFVAPSVDQLIGRFPNLEIEHLIGYGGMGAVYQARQTQLDRQVALKILAPTLSENEAFAQRFMREAKTLAKLSHPNIVMIFEFGKASDFHYLLMEYVDGINLRDAILEGTLSTRESLEIVPQICDALQYAHDEGVVHRDIKPENILVDKKGRVKIADFGLAKLLQPNENELRLTGTQQVLGTLNYMAPEQIEGRSYIDHRADIYSLGVVFYELLTGELPLGRFSNPSEKVGSPNQLDDVVMRTLEKEPDRRYQTASDVKSAVQLVPLAGLDTLEVVMADEAPIPAFPAKPDTPKAAPVTPNLQTAAFNQPFGLGSQVRQGDVEISLPFSIDQVYGGFAKAFGIAKMSNEQLDIEFEIRDDIFKTVRSKSKRIQIPVSEIASLELIKGFYNDRIDIQAKSLGVTDEIPNARSGQFSLKIKKSHRTNTETLVNRIQSKLNPSSLGSKSTLVGQPTLMEKLTLPFRGLLKWQPISNEVKPIEVSARFSGVRFWLITSGILNFVMMGGSMRLQIHRWLRENLPLHSEASILWVVQPLFSLDIVANPYSAKFVHGNSAWAIVVSILAFVTASKLDKLKSINFVALACGLFLLPVYPLYLLMAPWAFWAFTQLLRPSTIGAFEDCQSCDLDTPSAGKMERVPISGQRFISRLMVVSTMFVLASSITIGIVGTKFASSTGTEKTTLFDSDDPSQNDNPKEGQTQSSSQSGDAGQGESKIDDSVAKADSNPIQEPSEKNTEEEKTSKDSSSGDN